MPALPPILSEKSTLSARQFRGREGDVMASELDGFDPIRSYQGHDLFVEWEITDAARRNYIVRLPSGKIINLDWTPFHQISERDFERWVTLGCPPRLTCGPLRSEHLDTIEAMRRQAA